MTLTKDQVLALYSVLDWILFLSEESDMIFREELKQHAELRQMPHISSFERWAREDGRAEGREEGRVEGRAQWVTLVLQARFGELPQALAPNSPRGEFGSLACSHLKILPTENLKPGLWSPQNSPRGDFEKFAARQLDRPKQALLVREPSRPGQDLHLVAVRVDREEQLPKQLPLVTHLANLAVRRPTGPIARHHRADVIDHQSQMTVPVPVRIGFRPTVVHRQLQLEALARSAQIAKRESLENEASVLGQTEHARVESDRGVEIEHADAGMDHFHTRELRRALAASWLRR